jgi:predicted acetyltransferase
MKAKEEWIQKTMESLDRVSGAETSPFLAEKIRQRMQSKTMKTITIQAKVAWRIAACIALLAAINFFSCIHYQKNITSQSDRSNSFSNEYFYYLNSLQF